MRILLAALAAVSLAGCTTTQQSDIVAALTKGCQGEAALHASFVALSEAGIVKGSVIGKVEAAHAGVSVICANPAGMSDPYSALASLTAATIVVASALKEAS